MVVTFPHKVPVINYVRGWSDFDNFTKNFRPTWRLRRHPQFSPPHFCHFWPFLAKKSGFRTFFRNRTSDLSKTWSETEDNWFESWNASVVSEKILVLAVLSIFGSKIHCLWWHYMVLGWFWPFSSKPLMISCYVLLFKLSLLFKNGQWKFLFWQKIVAIFGTFFGAKFGLFHLKIRFSDIFSKPHIRFV